MRSHNIQLLFSILIYKIFAVCGGNLPPEVYKCKSTDNDKCIGKQIEEIFKLFPNGNPDFGMPNVAALNVTNLKVTPSNPNSAIQISFEFIKCTIYGLENTKILRTTGFDKELKNVILEAIMPNIVMKGVYESSGKLLLLPLNGKGKGEIKLIDTKTHVRAKLDLEKRNGKTYGKVKLYQADITKPKKMIVKLDNIFNGNPVLSDSINAVINENWEDVWLEMQIGINRAIEKVLKQLTRDILNELSIDDFYSD